MSARPQRLRLALLPLFCLALIATAVVQERREGALVRQQVRLALAHAAVQPGLTPRPPLGFNDWNAVHCGVDAAFITGNAAAMVSDGLRAAGYRYVNLDDCWSASSRTAAGRLVGDPLRFPRGMRALGAYLHTLGLKFGIYADVGTATCAGYPGSFAHEDTDAATFASWGVDYIKLDWCSVPYELFSGYTSDQIAQVLYSRWSAAVHATGRPMVLSVSNASDPALHPWEWGRAVANLWRTTPDITPDWSAILAIADANLQLGAASGPGHWNDPDMLEIGNGGLTLAEDRAHFGLWSMMSAPLLLGTDLRALRPAVRAIVTNRAVLAIDQDPLGRPARVVSRHGDAEVITKLLVDGDRAVLLLNRGAGRLTIGVRAADEGLPPAAHYRWRDLWTGVTSTNAGRLAWRVPPHSAVLLRVGPAGA